MSRGASRKVLLEMSTQNIPKKNVLTCVGKENLVDYLCKGQMKQRQPKVAKRRLNLVVEDEVPMEVEQIDRVESRIPDGVKNIDAEDASNPQLCTEYALEIYAYMKRGSVRSDHLSGCATSDMMRSVLVDWLVEV